jgi:chaperonin GroES
LRPVSTGTSVAFATGGERLQPQEDISDESILGGDDMTFRPLHDRILIRRIEADGKTAGGIIIPDTVKEKPHEGEVVAIGPGAVDEIGKRVAPDVKVGDHVLFGKWSGTEIALDGEDLLIMKESDLMGVIEGAPA